MGATRDDEREQVPTSDGYCSVRLVKPPCKRAARAMTAPGGIRIRRKQAVNLRPGSSSRFKGVSLPCRKGIPIKNRRWEVVIWDGEKQGQVSLGGYDNEEQAAAAYDIAVIKFRAHDAEARLETNYPISNYEQELLHLEEVSKEEVVQSMRSAARKKKKPSSQYPGVSKHTKCKKWEAKKYGKYLGLYKDEIGAAIACDKEAVRCRGIDAVTHFDLADYKELLDADIIKEAEKRHLFKPKLQVASTVTTETAHGLYYTQGGQGWPEGSTDMQLVQTDMQHSHEDIAAHNLQQYGDYMVIGHPTHAPAAHDSLYTDGQQEFVGSHTGAVRWYGSYSSGTDHAALVSPAAGPGEQVWNGQLPSQQAAWDKKRLPADVSRHNTPTSVFDIFNNLHISGTTASAQVADQLHQQLHMTGFEAGAVGEEPALTDIPHMAMHPQGYQATISDDDDWLTDLDFATAELHAPHSPESAHNGPEAEQAGEPIMPDHNMSQSTADANQQDK